MNGVKMNELLEKWCYGGQSRSFFKKQRKAIHKYNAAMLGNLLILMIVVLGLYLLLSLALPSMSNYTLIYLTFFISYLLFYFFFQLVARRNITMTQLCILVFSVMTFAFVCLIGTVYGTHTNAVMFLIFLLSIPLLLIVPMHYIYGFLTAAMLIFSIVAYIYKAQPYYYTDIAHSLTCLAIGFFIGRRVLNSRISLFAANDKLKKLSNIDPLTGLHNRRSLDEYLNNVYPVCHHMMVAMMDIDNFKQFNDTYGHQKGDMVLKTVSNCILHACHRKGCYVARYGGEEFVIIDTKHKTADFASMLDEIRCDVYNRSIKHKNSPYGCVTISIGYARKNALDDYQTIIENADQALYMSKATGKNRCLPYEHWKKSHISLRA
jgi:diguanylate cyclase (GGDEF)-like protein